MRDHLRRRAAEVAHSVCRLGSGTVLGVVVIEFDGQRPMVVVLPPCALAAPPCHVLIMHAAGDRRHAHWRAPRRPAVFPVHQAGWLPTSGGVARTALKTF